MFSSPASSTTSSDIYLSALIPQCWPCINSHLGIWFSRLNCQMESVSLELGSSPTTILAKAFAHAHYRPLGKMSEKTGGWAVYISLARLTAPGKWSTTDGSMAATSCRKNSSWTGQSPQPAKSPHNPWLSQGFLNKAQVIFIRKNLLHLHIHCLKKKK